MLNILGIPLFVIWSLFSEMNVVFVSFEEHYERMLILFSQSCKMSLFSSLHLNFLNNLWD